MEKYKTWADVPGHLATKKQLAQMGLRLAPEQKPAAIKVGGYGPYDLYDTGVAVPKAKATPAQLAALEKANQQRTLNSRCAVCGGGFFDGDRRIKINDTGNGAYICFICDDRQEATDWARQFLANPDNLILDTETTGLEEDDQIVEIAIINTTGQTVFTSLVKPTIPIPYGATNIHGITDSDVADAPAWPDLDAQIFDLLKRAPAIAIYNAEYDQRMIYQTRVAHGLAEADIYGYWWNEETGATPELIALNEKIICAMNIYAAWVGEWSSYHKSYRWQRLNGGHRALGDCQACLERIKSMAKEQEVM
jgi:hypothetical protein